VALDLLKTNEKGARLDRLRLLNSTLAPAPSSKLAPQVNSLKAATSQVVLEKDDPILQWASLHHAVAVRSDED
jgi:hypothetical protein